MATGAAFSVINGQLVQTNLDGAVAHKPVVGTCLNCNVANVVLASHRGTESSGWTCTNPTAHGQYAAGPYIDPNQSALATNQKGAAPKKTR